MEISKSWKMVIASFIIGVLLPLVNSQLPDTQQIDETFANNFIYLALGLGAVGAANAASKRSNKTKQMQLQRAPTPPIAQIPDIEEPPPPPTTPAPQKKGGYKRPTDLNDIDPIGPPPPAMLFDGGWYDSNFVKLKGGNGIPKEELYLWLRIRGAKSYTAANLVDATGRIRQAEQTGTKYNPWKDIVRFELYERVNGAIQKLPPGEYTIATKTGHGDGVKEKFILE